MDVSAAQPEKEDAPIEVTAEGISMDVNWVQFRKASLPIEVSEAGSETLSI